MLEEISDKELESLECPTINVQLDEWYRIINSISETKIKYLIESLDYDLIKLKHFSESNGIINKIFLLDCKHKSNRLVEEKLVLKIANPMEKWKKYKTTNEVAVMTYLRNNTKIPVPKIISFSNESSTSLIGCEYILMEFVNGKCLKDVLSQKADQLPKKLIDQFIGILRQLRSIKLEDPTKIGYFDENMKLHAKLTHGTLCDKFIDYFEHHLRHYLNEMKKLKKFVNLANEVEESLNKLVKIVNENTELDGLNFRDQMSLSHNDLNPTNILVNENSFEITAIIDWEWSMHGFDDEQLDFFKTWYTDKNEKEIIKELMATKYQENFEKNIGREIRKKLDKLFELVFDVTFYLASDFSEQTEIKYTNDMNINVRLHIERSAEKLKEYLKTLPQIFDELANFKLENKK